MSLTSDTPASVAPSRSLSLELGRDGGEPPVEPAGAPVITSVVDNGDGTLTIQGSSFGEKQQASPVLYDHTDSVWENGVENLHHSGFTDGQLVQRANNDPDTLWHKPYIPDENSTGMLVVRSRPKRHPVATAHYYGAGPKSALGWPNASNGEQNGVGGDRSYVSFFLKMPFNLSRYWAIPGDANTGNFVLNGQYEYGENLLIDGQLSGRVMHYYPGLGMAARNAIYK